MKWSTRLAAVMTVATAAVMMTANPAMADYNPVGAAPEPTGPYPLPSDANLPVRGCATTVADPTVTTGSIPAVQPIYAWSDEDGEAYEAHVEIIAKLMDRVDWIVDESSNYDQHVNFSCRTGFDTGTYAGYARSLVVPVRIPNANIGGETAHSAVRADLEAAGFDDPNRTYLIFEDFDGGASGFLDCYGGPDPCTATLDEWSSLVATHELLHNLGAHHSWGAEIASAYVPDTMIISGDWQLDQDFNSYYDPSELSASFYVRPEGSGSAKVNVAAHPVLTTPVCCDVGYNNDLLTAQERTIEADAPWSSPTGFTFSGGGWIQVTPPGANQSFSARYYDGRRSATINVQSHAEGSMSVTRKPAVTAGTTYKFFTRMTVSGTSGDVHLRLAWYDSSGAPISISDGSSIALDTTWREYSFAAEAPVGATQVQLSVVSPAGQNFSYLLDSLQLNECVNPTTSDGCRVTTTW